MRYSIRLFLSIALALTCNPAFAQAWEFNKPVDVTATSGPGIFHHLESAGRRNIAVSGNTIAIVWEDDHTGTPAVYLARKTRDETRFTGEIKISGKGEAYEPGIIALSNNRFALVWEEDERVVARVIGPKDMGPALLLGNTASSQASLAVSGNQIVVALSERSKRHGRIMLHQLQVKNQLQLNTTSSCIVDPAPVKNEQLYPVVSVLGERIIVAWEDRRPGHTIIMVGESKTGKACEFTHPVRISEQPEGPKMPYGAGHGVARVALGNYGKSGLFAVWADKRNFQEGYDIYGANRQADGTFPSNVRVQDDFGGAYRQWHSTVTGHPNGHLVVAWTDERDGNTDIWLSWLEDGDWSEDVAVAGASGPGEQSHPSIVMDTQGNLHVAWVERATVGGATRLRYLFGQATN
ncbi:MAG: hypothetical protein OQL16_08470 [Gammaproteobacteria bacterium]|nr:hypothetical protein [Gammaproteobacteria bacterium]